MLHILFIEKELLRMEKGYFYFLGKYHILLRKKVRNCNPLFIILYFKFVTNLIFITFILTIISPQTDPNCFSNNIQPLNDFLHGRVILKNLFY